MHALQWVQGMRRFAATPDVWLLAAMFVGAIALHYPDLLLPAVDTGPDDSLPGESRHAMERVLFLLPVTYAGFVFGIRVGLLTLALAAIAMLPRALFISSTPYDALLETGAVILVGGLVNMWFEGHLRERKRRQEVFLRLQLAQSQLQSQLSVIQMSETQLAAVNAISNIVSQSLELREILNLAADKVMEVANMEIILIFLVDEAANELVLETYRGVSEEFAASVKKMKIGEGFNGRAAATGEPLVVEDVVRDSNQTATVASQEKIQSQLIVPLRSKGKVLGTLCLATRRPRRFAPEEVELLSAGGMVIGMAVENARLYQEERLMAEQLRMSERRFRDLFENAQDAIWVQDMEGRIIMANNASAKLTGYGQDELIGMRVGEILSEEALAQAREVRRRLLRGGELEQPYEQRITTKDGREVLLWLTTSLITGGGQPRAFQIIARDVTEQRRMEENLRFFLHHATMAQEEERRRIARELHDDTAQHLVALARQIEKIKRPPGRLSKEQMELLEELEIQVDNILEGVRRFSQDLRPSILDDLGLLPALEWLTSDVTEHFGIDVEMAVLGGEHRFSPEVELSLFRIAQEALRNVWKHSEASRAWVTLDFADGKTTLRVRDDGKGFEVPRRVADLAKVGKLGLAGLEERARLVGGKLTLESQPNEGATVTVEVPA